MAKRTLNSTKNNQPFRAGAETTESYERRSSKKKQAQTYFLLITNLHLQPNEHK